MDLCYVVRTHPLMESVVAGRLGCAFVPTYEKEVRHKRHVSVRRVPLYPTYIFVYWNFEARGAHEIMRMHGVRQILGMPSPVETEVVDRLRETCIGLTDRLEVGERVWMRDWECEGLFDGYVENRCRVLVSLLGRSTVREVGRYGLERVQ